MKKIEQYKQFKEANGAMIKSLVAKIGEISEDAHWDLIDDMKGVFGSDAANESSDDEEEQENALSNAEEWVADNCSSGGIAEDVAMALFLRGMSEGEALLLKGQKSFYVWCDGDCQNKTHSRKQAIEWCSEFIASGQESYVVDEENDTIEVPMKNRVQQKQAPRG